MLKNNNQRTMSVSIRDRLTGKKKTKEKKTKPEIDVNEKFFLISLYPKGRSEGALFEQLKEKYPTTNEMVIRERMKKWVVRMHAFGLVQVVPTEDIGNVISLTKGGMEYVRKKIDKLLKKDIDTFVEIVNRLMQDRDQWTIEYYKYRSEKMVKTNLPLYAVIFNPKPLHAVISDLKLLFNWRLEDLNRQKKLEDDIKIMESFGLIDIVYDEEGSILSASERGKEIYAKIIQTKSSTQKGTEKELEKTKKKNAKNLKEMMIMYDKFVVASVFISLIFVFVILVSSFPIDPVSQQLTVDNHYGIYVFMLVPLLTLIFYIIISKGYLFYQKTKK